MKKRALALSIIFIFSLSMLVGTKLVYWAEANPAPYDSSGTSQVEVSILSPQNKTYDTNNIELTVDAGAFPGVWYLGFSLDGGSYVEITPGHPLLRNLTETVSLSQLPKGSHSIEVQATAMANDEDGVVIACSKVHFTITKTVEPAQSSSPTATDYFVPAPTLEITYPLNTTYSGELAQAIPLRIDAIVLADAPAVVSISYSLDGGANITFTDLGKTGEFPSESGRAVAYHIGHAALNNLANVTHTLKAYSSDVNSNEMSDSVEFTVSGGLTPTFSAFDILSALLCLVVVAITLVSLVYLKKHKREAASKQAKFSLACMAMIAWSLLIGKLFFSRNSLFFRESIKAVNSILTQENSIG